MDETVLFHQHGMKYGLRPVGRVRTREEFFSSNDLLVVFLGEMTNGLHDITKNKKAQPAKAGYALSMWE